MSEVKLGCPKDPDIHAWDDSKFCQTCGLPLVVKNGCPKCGAETYKWYKFCRACGASFSKKSWFVRLLKGEK